MTDATVHFSQIQGVLRQELMNAKSRIQVAVAWFTDQELYDILLEKAADDISVTVIIRNDSININSYGIDWQKLIDANGVLFLSNHSSHLHHKFCLIDNNKGISGSYNWTYAAQKNQENVIVLCNLTVIKDFQLEFSKLIDSAHEVESITATYKTRPPVRNDFLEAEFDNEIKFREELKRASLSEANYDELIEQAAGCYLRKEYREAERMLKEALSLKQNAVAAYELLSTVYWRTEEFSEAIAAAKQAESRGVNSAELWNSFGLAFNGQKRFKEAIEYFERSIKLDPGVSTWHHNKFGALEASGQSKLADRVAFEAMEVASHIIKNHKRGDNDHQVVRAYIERANLRVDPPTRRKDAKDAYDLFQQLPVDEQDLHDLDDIRKHLPKVGME